MIAEPRPWLLPMCPGDEVACGSCDAYGIALTQHSEARLIYADDDLIDASGRRHAPHFKPDWNPELFDTHDYISGAAIVCADRESLSNLPHAGWKAALVRAALRDKAAPVHIHQVLHHRVSRPEPRVPSKISSLPRFERRLVSVIIPTRNSCDLLRTCIDGLHRASYAPIETIVIDNGSDDRQTLEYLKQLENEGVTWLRLPGPFNYSALNNAAAKLARGDFLCFLNNDVEMRDSDWLTLLVHQAQREELGAVGARLLYADGTIQHAGVVTGIGGGAGHAHRFQASNDLGYFARAHLPQRVSAVTAACLVVAKGKFLEVGGFDEIDFPVAFNDVDLCLKLNARGWQSFYEPRATLIHHESRSRGSDRSRLNRARFAGELAALKKKWNTDRNRDPYHHPDLSPFCEQFLIAV